MAIPQSPLWSSIADIGEYPKTSFPKPVKPADICGISIGPAIIDDSQGKLNGRYWAVCQSGSNIVLFGSVGDSWGDEIVLFQEARAINKIAITFDQLGRAIVFYQIGSNLYLFWYDPTVSDKVTTLISTGISIVASFDIINDTSDPLSDAMIFYTRSNIIYMRIQRDRWAVEYPESIFLGDGVTPVTRLELLNSGMRVDNRFQVVYRYIDSSYVPPTPIPPVVVPQTGYWSYKLSGMGSAIKTGKNIVDIPNDKVYSVGLDIDSVVLPTVSISSVLNFGYVANYEVMIFSQNNSPYPGQYGAGLMCSIDGASNNILRLVVGGQLNQFRLPWSLSPGRWEFEFDLNSINERVVRVGFLAVGGAVMDYSSWFAYQAGTVNETEAVFVFCASHYDYRGYNRCLSGVARNLTIRHPVFVKDMIIRVDDNNDGDHPKAYDSDGNQITSVLPLILDYRPSNWVFNE